MFAANKCAQALVLVAVLIAPGSADCLAQMIGQSIPDGTAVEVRAGGQTRRGVVSGYMSGEYRVQYEGGAFDSEWVPETNVHRVAAPAAKEPRKTDLAPLYQAVGAAMCPLALVAAVVIFLVMRTGRRAAGESPFPSGPFPPSQSP